ncbi:PREDICTED: uncharacterized protein LOC105452570 isoform X2 [Wasmannia auropunctata]|uniref:uncharacterized protein LOC105452570 isoform X2 n=1 Tax=Wasmannia auropunctata TaxID=64793 RepID=UPI0005EDAA8B|nr:PREDICTED: uncharacterized protein LOC105452570 isoform X2 [Wasmannia auropunctata]
MASYRSYGDTGAYRSRTGVGIASTFGRNVSGGSNLPSCRSSYSGVGSSSARTVAKERALAGFGGTFLKKDKFEEKPAFKYSCTKDTDKSRLHSGRSSSEDVRAKSPLSDSRSSLLEKYSFSAGKTSERPSSVLDRYNRPASREKSREPEGISRYGSSTYPGSSFGRSYGNDARIEKKDHPPVSYRGLRPNSGKTSREPSPEVSVGKTNSFRVYSRAPSYSRSAASPNTSDSSSATISTRFGSTAGSRFLSPRSGNERMSTTMSYSTGGRFRNLNSKSTNQKEEQGSRFTAKSNKDDHQELSTTANRIEENETNNKLPDKEFVTLTVVTRGTSPTPPASSSYVRNRRAEINVVHQKEVIKLRKLPDTADEEIQCDQTDETSRFSRYSSNNKISGVPWSTYLDKYSGTSLTGSPSIYSSRGFNSSSSSGRLNNFAYARTNETPATTRNESSAKEPSSSSQEIHNSDKSQNEKRLGDLNCTTNNETLTVSNDLKTSLNDQNTHNINKEDRINERCCCGAQKTETNESSNNLRNSNQNLAFYRRKDSMAQDTQNASRCNEYKKPISRLECTSPKNEVKISKCSSKTEMTSKLDAYNERRGSTPKSDASSSSRIEESLRIVEGHCQEQNEEVISQKRDASQRKDSTSSGSSQSRLASTSQTRNVSTKNMPRQMTRTASSDGSSVSMPIGRSKSSSASSVTSQGIKIKTATPPSSGKSSTGSILPSVNLRQGGSPDARGKPPVPKNDTTTAATPKCTVAAKYVNKDFRKSTLNMENGDLSCSKYARIKKSQRNISVSSQDSEMTSDHVPQAASSGSLISTKSGRSRFRIPSGESKPVLGRNGSNGSTKWEESKSGSKSPCGTKKRPSGTFSSSNSSQSTSANSSSSEDDDNRTDKTDSRRRRKRTMEESPAREVRGKISAGSSRTSVLASSADDMSMMAEKPPRPPSSPRSKSDRSAKTEEAKSFLMRALAPVTNFFKNKNQDSDDTNKSDGWIDSFEENHEAKNKSEQLSSSRSASQNLLKDPSFTNSQKSDGIKGNNVRIQHQSSGEKPWWLDPNSENVPEGVHRASPWNNDISQDTTVSAALPDDGKYKLKIWRQGSEEHAWWLDEIVTEETKKSPSPVSSISRRGSSRGSFRSADRRNRIRHQQSGERAWWMSDDPENVPEGIEVIPVASADSQSTDKPVDNESLYSSKPLKKIRHIESGEKAWWMDSTSNVPDGIVRIPVEIPNSTSDSSESYEKIDIGINPESQTCVKRSLSRFPIEFPPPPSEPLGDRASPEGIENPPDPPDNYGGRKSPYDNVQPTRRRLPPRKRPSTLPLFIGDHTDIDDVIGDTAIQCHSPVLSRVRKQERVKEDFSENSSECEEIAATQVIIHDSTPKTPVIQRRNRDDKRIQPDGYIPLDDTALQLYKGGDYGAYLDLEASINEQQEEFEGFHEGESRKNAIILRTQLSVRVHTIIEKLLNSEGRELRRALFSLKQIFQEDKDLVHEFVQNDGLACLIKVSSEADQNYQNYILRALGQVMLYVDGMNGVMEHGQTVEWLYTLIASRFRLVVKTALKLLLVFVEYVETNSLLLVRAVRAVDQARGVVPWINVMKLLKDYDAADTELLIYATTLINKCLNGIPDQDTYYDQVDCLEEQGMEGVIQRYMSKQGTDLDLLRQFQIYEAVLHHEDGDRGSPIRQLDDNIRKTLRNRKSLVDSHERRKSRRHSTGNSPLSMSLNARLSPRLNHSLGVSTLNNTLNSNLPDDDDESSSSQSSHGHLGEVQLNGSYKENKVDVGVTPALRRRRERAERQRSFIREQQEATANMRASLGHTDDQESQFATNSLRYTNGTSYERNADSPSNKLSRTNSRKDLTPLMNAANKLDSEEKKPWYGKSPNEGVEYNESNHTDEDEDRRVVLQLKREGTVKDLTQKLAAQNLIPSSPVEEKVSRIGDMSGLISKAKEGLAKSKSKADVLKSPTGDNLPKLQETKKSENELHWEELVKKLKRPLALCDLDFTDLNSEDETDVLGSANVTNGVPPPPPPMAPPNGDALAPPPPPLGARLPPPLPQGPPLPFGISLKMSRPLPLANETSNTPKSPPSLLAKKSKKTVKLFWKEVRDDPNILARLDKHKMIWDELTPVAVDTQKLEHLFESRAKDLITKEKQQEMNKNKEIIVLNHKRSNAINIGMTKLPPPRSIKTAILKMDATIMNREGIEKLLTMLPTKEEKSRIQEAQAANPDLPLGSAEQFLLTLTSISELPARLKLWAFKLDFENSEKEIADPLMDLKQGMETLRVNKTFRGILSTLLSIGIFLNGNEVKGFQLEYLVKVPEVKDTVHKHSLLHHLCHMVMEKFPDSTDLYSEIGAVTRASKIDFDELAANIAKLESECKASWDHLKLIAKHDGSTMMKVKMSDFLADCAERIIVLGIVHRRIINRFRKFILWLGIPLHRIQDTKPNEFCRIVSEFALEYRTTRERVIQQLEKKANHRERNKTRGKMITEVGKFRTKEDRADAELRQLLGSDISDVESIHGTLPWRRQKKDGRIIPLGPVLRDESTNGNLADGVDELLESLVKTATKTPATRTTPRERKRTRHADLRRTLKNGLSEEEKKHIAAYIKGY